MLDSQRIYWCCVHGGFNLISETFSSAAARRVLAATAVGALALSSTVIAATPAAAATCNAANSATDFAGLQTLIDDSSLGEVCLGGDITSPSGDRLTLPSGRDLVFDLNGSALTITAPSGRGEAAIRVADGQSLTIEDSAGGGVLQAQGGSWAAGIGADKGRRRAPSP